METCKGYKGYDGPTSLAIISPCSYVKTNSKDLIELRFDVMQPFKPPAFGTCARDSNGNNLGATPAEAKAFAWEIIRQAEELEKKERLPEYWPPQNGDVWKSSMGYEYHVNGDTVTSDVPGDVQPLQIMIKAVESGHKRVLVHRVGWSSGKPDSK